MSKGYRVTEPALPANLAGRLGEFFTSCADLGHAFNRDAHKPVDPSAWTKYHEANLARILHELRTFEGLGIESVLTTCASIKAAFNSASRTLREIECETRTYEGQTSAAYLRYFRELNQLAYQGLRGVHEARRQLPLDEGGSHSDEPIMKIEAPTAILKSEIEVTNQFRGKVNSGAVTVAGIEFAPRTLRYVTPASRLNIATRFYEGVHRFEALSEPDDCAQTCDFSKLPNHLEDSSALTSRGNSAVGTSHKSVVALPESSQSRNKVKRSTVRGEAKDKLIAALTAHHDYFGGNCLNYEPIGSNQLAGAARVSKSTASRFLREWFGGFKEYRIMCREKTKLNAALRLVNNEFRPKELNTPRPNEIADQSS